MWRAEHEISNLSCASFLIPCWETSKGSAREAVGDGMQSLAEKAPTMALSKVGGGRVGGLAEDGVAGAVVSGHRCDRGYGSTALGFSL